MIPRIETPEFEVGMVIFTRTNAFNPEPLLGIVRDVVGGLMDRRIVIELLDNQRYFKQVHLGSMESMLYEKASDLNTYTYHIANACDIIKPTEYWRLRNSICDVL